MIRPLDQHRWIVHDGLQELAHFLYLVDALNFCARYDEPDPLQITKHGNQSRPWAEYMT